MLNPDPFMLGKLLGQALNRAQGAPGVPSDLKILERRLVKTMNARPRADGELCCELCGRVLTSDDCKCVARSHSGQWLRTCVDCGLAHEAQGSLLLVGAFTPEPEAP